MIKDRLLCMALQSYMCKERTGMHAATCDRVMLVLTYGVLNVTPSAFFSVSLSFSLCLCLYVSLFLSLLSISGVLPTCLYNTVFIYLCMYISVSIYLSL